MNPSRTGLHGRQFAHFHSHAVARDDVVSERNHTAHPRDRMRVDSPFAIGKLDAPDVFAGFHAVHANLSRFGTARIAHPDHAKACLLLAMLDADHVALLAGMFKAGDARSCTGYVD